MANPSNAVAAAILEMLVETDKQLGELFVTAQAQNLALQELVPNFRERYEHSLDGPECQRLRNEFEKKIRAAHEGIRKLSEQWRR